MLKYDIRSGVKKIKTKTATSFTIGILGFAGLGSSLAFIPALTHADSSGLINFEDYNLGTIDSQQGWSATGSVTTSCGNGLSTPYDESIVSNGSAAPSSFGTKSFRISNAVTSGCFGDQAFAPHLGDVAGEPDAIGLDGNPVVSPKPHFEAQFDIASTTQTNQGMVLSVSPDRGDGARMSYIRFEDQVDGIHAHFVDVTDPTHATGAETFNDTDIATLSYTSAHTIKFSMDFVSGPDNDSVKIYVDGVQKASGTSWEDYYRFDTESNPGLTQNDSRTVSTLLFREGGTAVPGNAGKGYLIDNLSMASGATPANLPTSKDQCMNNGWKNFGNAFKNQGDCVSFIATKGKNQPTNPPTAPATIHSATGTATLSNPNQVLSLNVYDNGISANDTGYITYNNVDAGLLYTTPPTCVNVVGKTAYIAYQIPADASQAAGTWVVWKIVDNGSSGDVAGFAIAGDKTSANTMCETASVTPSVYNAAVTTGDFTVL